MSGYSIQVDPARRVVDVTGQEGEELDRQATRLTAAVDAGTAAAGSGSPVAAALGELRARHEQVARADRELVERATGAARTAIAAYKAADGQMAEQYGPFPVVPGRPVVPDLVNDILDQNGFPRLPPR
jgi:Family of unknown function (DUF6507)